MIFFKLWAIFIKFHSILTQSSHLKRNLSNQRLCLVFQKTASTSFDLVLKSFFHLSEYNLSSFLFITGFWFLYICKNLFQFGCFDIYNLAWKSSSFIISSLLGLHFFLGFILQTNCLNLKIFPSLSS